MADTNTDRDAAVPGGRQAQELHQQIMNLPCDPLDWDAIYVSGFRHGHKDARHAAAELVSTLASSLAPGIPVEQVQALSARWDDETEGRSDVAAFAIRSCADQLDALIASASAQGSAPEDDDPHTGDDDLLDELTSARAALESIIEDSDVDRDEAIGDALEALTKADALRVAQIKSVSPPAPQWRPMESAPKDRPIVVLTHTYNAYTVHHDQGSDWLLTRDGARAFRTSELAYWTDPPASSSPTASAKGK